jgi:hypothetical protein
VFGIFTSLCVSADDIKSSWWKLVVPAA